ncbi:MAG: DUF1080 domain-containing protein [Candidatus Hydrogenedentes bacterium]|nr:DUF1080 domain-containing protein [Candidatus Hydrogenedentota bacterium]
MSYRISLALCMTATLLAGCMTLSSGIGDDDLHIQNGQLNRGKHDFTLKAIMVPELGAGRDELEKTSPLLAKIAYVGGNAACTDLAGFNADGTYINPEDVATIGKLGHRAKEQRMAILVRVLGSNTDPAFCANAVKTAAEALQNERRAVYYFDGPDAVKGATQFRELAPKLVVVAPEVGHVIVVTETPEAPAANPTLVVGKAHSHYDLNTHFLLGSEQTDYDALEAVLTNEVQKQPWTPENSVLSEAERKDGFISLMNKKDFSGWWQLKDMNSFIVNERGEFEFKEAGGKAILTRNRYSDFILRLDFMIEEGGNSGIFLRAPRDARQSKIGMEFQIHGDYGVAPDDDCTGAIYKVKAPKENASNPCLTWNQVEIMLDGSHMKATLNGRVVHDFDLNAYEELKYRLKEGFIGLQDHHHFVAFRNVRIKELN